MGKLEGVYLRLSMTLDHMPRVKFALKFMLVTLTLIVLLIPFFYSDHLWARAAIVLILVVDGIAFFIPSNPDQRRSRR